MYFETEQLFFLSPQGPKKISEKVQKSLITPIMGDYTDRKLY